MADPQQISIVAPAPAIEGNPYDVFVAKPSEHVAKYATAIGSIESGGAYDKLGPSTRTGDRAYGKYQVMGENVGPWTKEVLGRELTPQQFLSDPVAQEKVFGEKFGSYVNKYGPEGAAKAWFAGEKGMNNPDAKDILGTSVADYGRKFTTAMGGGENPYAQFTQKPSDATAPAATAEAPTATAEQPKVGQLEAAGLGVGRGLTANFLDELTGLSAVAPKEVSGALSRVNGGNPLAAPIMGAALLGLEYLKGGDAAVKRYQQAASESLARSTAAQQQFPKTSMAGEMAGAALIPMGGAVRGTTLAGRMAQSAKVGATYGLASGIGGGTNFDERVLGGALGGVGGAAVGAAVPAAISAVGAIPSAGRKLVAQLGGNPPMPKAPPPTAETLRAAAQVVYARLDNAVVVFKPSAINAIATDIVPKIKHLGYDEQLHPNAKRALERIWDSRASSLTWNELDTVRRVVMAAGKKTQDANELSIIEKMKQGIDSFVSRMTDKDVLALPGDRKLVQDLSPVARKLWNESSKLDRIDDLVHRAQITASSKFSDSGLENALRTQFKQLSLNKSEIRLFSADERKAIEKVAGLGAFNAARDVGRMAPKGPVSIFTGGGAGYAFGNAIAGPVGGLIGGAAVLGTGLAARKLATRLTQKNIEALQMTIANGGTSPFAQAALTQSQRTLNILMAPAARAATSNATREQQFFQETR